MVHARVNPALALAAKCAAQHWAHYATASPSASASPSVGSFSESPGAQWMLQAKRGREEVWYISSSSACPLVPGSLPHYPIPTLPLPEKKPVGSNRKMTLHNLYATKGAGGEGFTKGVVWRRPRKAGIPTCPSRGHPQLFTSLKQLAPNGKKQAKRHNKIWKLRPKPACRASLF